MENGHGPENGENSFQNKDSKEDILEFTDMIGGCGKWQRKIFLITFFFGISQVWNHLGMTFLALPVDHWCARPDGSNITTHMWKTLFIPNMTDNEEHYSQCTKYVLNSSADGDVIITSDTETCTEFEYSSAYHSIIEEVSRIYICI